MGKNELEVPGVTTPKFWSNFQTLHNLVRYNNYFKKNFRWLKKLMIYGNVLNSDYSYRILNLLKLWLT